MNSAIVNFKFFVFYESVLLNFFIDSCCELKVENFYTFKLILFLNAFPAFS